MTMIEAAEIAAAEIADWFEAVFSELDTLSARVGSAMVDARGRRSRFIESDIKPVKIITSEFLARHEFIEAAGVILAPGAIDDDRGTIEWWRHDENGTNDKVVFNLTPESGSFYDFQNLNWFDNAVAIGTSAITGPYVDYGGLDQYILTLTAPLHVGEGLVAMVGCDIEVRDLERVMIPLLRRIPGDAALINAQGHVILGNSGRFLVGNRVRGVPDHGAVVSVDVRGLGLGVVCAEPVPGLE